MGHYSRSTEMKFNKETKILDHKRVSLKAIVALLTLVGLFFNCIQITYFYAYQAKRTSFWLLWCEREAILIKRFPPCNPERSVHIRTFSLTLPSAYCVRLHFPFPFVVSWYANGLGYRAALNGKFEISKIRKNRPRVSPRAGFSYVSRHGSTFPFFEP